MSFLAMPVFEKPAEG